MVITKEELERKYEQDPNVGYAYSKELDEKTKNLAITVEFNVVCNSSPYVGEDFSVLERIQSYVKACGDTMDESMRHWGDHEHCINPMKVIITNVDTDEEQDITKEVLTDDLLNKMNY